MQLIDVLKILLAQKVHQGSEEVVVRQRQFRAIRQVIQKLPFRSLSVLFNDLATCTLAVTSTCQCLVAEVRVLTVTLGFDYLSSWQPVSGSDAVTEICGAKDKGTLSHVTVAKWYKRFESSNLVYEKQPRFGRLLKSSDRDLQLKLFLRAVFSLMAQLCSTRSKNSKRKSVSGQDNNGRRSMDCVSYRSPCKLCVPCARVETKGEWFQIDRVLDTISFVSSDRIIQSLVQRRPTWLKLLKTSPSARHFHGRVKVIGCVVKESILRSRASKKTKWTHKEFMCLMFRERIDSFDGSSTYEDLPYRKLKGRFPTALFEFFERRMPSARVSASDEPRRGSLLSISYNINVPRCVYIQRRAQNENLKKSVPKWQLRQGLSSNKRQKKDRRLSNSCFDNLCEYASRPSSSQTRPYCGSEYKLDCNTGRKTTLKFSSSTP
ncbi:hypothetical protein KIN20_022885 [Parelaphostrongylus tenuis]|uniref:Mos1 transposase HTH domain-containing protein n=1 Tax=Parelaphostrongylus tenuis TaxID=148309 RepID=A0AAD5QVN7_PARTN|nr:hypothetical protein KIN20_022885 [Parelaphostrongylus tenuis]